MSGTGAVSGADAGSDIGTDARLRVAVATPFALELIEHLAELEPRLDIDYRPELTGPAGDNWMAPWSRPAEAQPDYEAYVDAAEALLGVPDNSGKALARTVAANPSLRWVHTIPAGGGAQVRSAHLDQDALERIAFTTSAGVHAQPLAEFAVFGVLAGLKQLPRLRAAQGAHEWAARESMRGIRGSTVAVVGLGSIGRRTAELLAALGATVVGVHRHEVDAPGVDRVEPVARLGEVLAESDAVVFALPDTEQTRGMLGASALAGARPGLAVVNVGRGSSIDEDALVAAIRDGRVGSATLDVTAVEPLPADSALWDLDEVVISPHTAAQDPGESALIVELFADNARRLLDGQPLRNRVNIREFY